MKADLSEGEWTLMNQLWDAPYSTITELTNALRERTGWDKHTILSMLARLEKKEAAAYRDGGRAKEFYPVLVREEALRREAARFLEKSGGVPRLGRALRESLTPEDVSDLARMLEQGG
ncbi:MAG: BlaI/MecI/CopY family transcriptional regulator [Oscillibacter sp.]|nr:BlaI/MecI/CopY family transcriptional regulator [Oscillibacter sp.]